MQRVASDLDRFGLTGGSGGEHHVRRRTRACGAVGHGSMRLDTVQLRGQVDPRQGQSVHGLSAAGRQHRADPVDPCRPGSLRQPVLQQDEGRTRFQHTHHAHDGIEGSVHLENHLPSRGSTGGGQSAGDPLCYRGQLTIGQGALPVAEGDTSTVAGHDGTPQLEQCVGLDDGAGCGHRRGPPPARSSLERDVSPSVKSFSPPPKPSRTVPSRPNAVPGTSNVPS